MVRQKKSDFHTLAPVDMQWFFHSRCDFFTVLVLQEAVCVLSMAVDGCRQRLALTRFCLQATVPVLVAMVARLYSCRPKSACMAIASSSSLQLTDRFFFGCS